MTRATIRIIREEHAALSAMLRSILLLLAQHRQGGSQPDFASLRAMLFYVDEFPEKRHHRKESELLFPKLRARTPKNRELLDRLDGDHARGERSIADKAACSSRMILIVARVMCGSCGRRAGATQCCKAASPAPGGGACGPAQSLRRAVRTPRRSDAPRSPEH